MDLTWTRVGHGLGWVAISRPARPITHGEGDKNGGLETADDKEGGGGDPRQWKNDPTASFPVYVLSSVKAVLTLNSQVVVLY